MPPTLKTLPGHSHPLGATVTPVGVNFCIFSRNCRSVELLLFDPSDAEHPRHVVPLDPDRNRTFYYWHILVVGIPAGTLYGFRVDGPFEPSRGHRFDRTKLLLDPYARAVVVPPSYDRDAARRPGDNVARAMKGVVVDPFDYDWEGDEPLARPLSDTIIYEMHVRGFTASPNSRVAAERRGTYLGLVDKIPYLKALGVTAVELLPVQQFDRFDAPKGHENYWGYSPVALFAPHRGYCVGTDALAPVREFREMVKACHRENIEVILDVVFNHTTEGDETGPCVSLRGLENRAYYLLESQRYANYTGCGNTLNANHSVVRRLIIDCLRTWVHEYHVDGFRFDLASVMARDQKGVPLENPPILWEIESDPMLAGTKIIAEAWDAAGLYQVGTFIGHKWAEWNGHFRDDARRFVKGDGNTVGLLAQRLVGSPDIYPQPGRDAGRSINFITAHDGFTLNDLVSYDRKHNEANGEDNRDGTNENHSWNCGVEGPTEDAEVEALRVRQIKNFLCLLFLSQGTSMLLMGDEVRRTQGGNNNAYCQDNPIGWFDWSLVERNTDVLRFTRQLISFVRARAVFSEPRIWTVQNGGPGHVRWSGVEVGRPDFGDASHSLAYTLSRPEEREMVHVILNAWWNPLEFELPKLTKGRRWYRIIDTAQASPDDFIDLHEALPHKSRTYSVSPRSAVVLLA